MHFDSWFFYFTLLYTSLSMLLLPWFGCSHVFNCPDTPPPEGNMMSISYLIRREPLATTYAYVGGLFLFSVVYCQVDNQKDSNVSIVRFLASFVSAKLLAIPLILPLGSVKSSSVHVVCFLLGAYFEVLVCGIIYYERKRRPWLAVADSVFLVATACLATATVAGTVLGMGHPHNAGVYALLSMEYLFGLSLAVTSFITHKFKY